MDTKYLVVINKHSPFKKKFQFRYANQAPFMQKELQKPINESGTLRLENTIRKKCILNQRKCVRKIKETLSTQFCLHHPNINHVDYNNL